VGVSVQATGAEMTKRSTQMVAVLAILAAAPWIMATTGDRGVDDESTVVTIVGEGQSEQAARLITVQAGVESFAKTATGAMRDNSDAMTELRSQLARFGIDPKDIRTTRLDLSRGTDPKDSDVKGFSVSHMLTIVFRDIGKSGAIIDALVNAGANQVQGPSFSWEATDLALETARMAAIRDADHRADFFAKALGLKVKRIVTMRDGGGSASGQPTAMRAAPAGTEISPGQDVVRASVYGEYELVR
jgi:uncharacterized protein